MKIVPTPARRVLSADPTKARLLDAAGREFAEKGFDCATVRSICSAAGVNLSAIRYHFGDKEQLYFEAVVEAYRCGAAPEGWGDPNEGSTADRLRRFVRGFLDQVAAKHRAGTWQHHLMLREMERPTGATDALVRQFIRPKFDRLVAIMRQACPEADDRRLHALAFSVIGQCLHYKSADPIAVRLIGRDGWLAMDLDFLAGHIAGFTLAALGLTPPLDAAGRPFEESDQTAVSLERG